MGGDGTLRQSIEFGQASVLKRLEVGTNRKLAEGLVCFTTWYANTSFVRHTHFIEARVQVQ